MKHCGIKSFTYINSNPHLSLQGRHYYFHFTEKEGREVKLLAQGHTAHVRAIILTPISPVPDLYLRHIFCCFAMLQVIFKRGLYS